MSTASLTHITLPRRTISAALSEALHSRRWERFADLTIRGKRTAKTPALHEEAARLLAVLDAEAFTAPPLEVRQKLIAQFDQTLGALVANPRDPEKREAWRLAVEAITEDVPAGAWTAEFRRDALRSFKFMPTPAEFYELLDKHVQALRNKRATLWLFVDEPIREPEKPRTPPTEEQKRHVNAIVANLFPTQREKRHA